MRFVVMLAVIFATPLLHAAKPRKQNVFPEGERLLYTRLIESYRRGQLDEVRRYRELLEKKYPTSIHIDNAYYLNGMLEFQNARYGEALKLFSVVTDKLKRSNKRASALFAKGVTYDRLGIKDLSVSNWKEVIKEYPGSPEAQRAWMHLRLKK